MSPSARKRESSRQSAETMDGMLGRGTPRSASASARDGKSRCQSTFLRNKKQEGRTHLRASAK